MDRVYNVEKTRKRKHSDPGGDDTAKKRGRPKRIITLETRYPQIFPPASDPAEQQKVEALAKEMEREISRKEVVLPLMKATFYNRRQFILNNDELIVSKLDRFPALKMISVVRTPALYMPYIITQLQIEQELELILSKQGLQRTFSSEWSQKWVPSIILYSKGLKRKDIKDTLNEMDKGR